MIIVRALGVTRGGTAVAVYDDLPTVKALASASLGFAVAELRLANTEALVVDLAVLKDQDVVVCTTASQEASEFGRS